MRIDPVGKRCRVHMSGFEGSHDPYVVVGCVAHQPYAEGDSWEIVEDDGTAHFIQRFDELVILGEEERKG